MPAPDNEPETQSSPKSIAQAIADGDIDRVRGAIESDPDFVRLRVARNLTPLQLAAYCGRREIAGLLLDAGAKLDISSACVLGDAEAVAKMLDADPRLLRKQSPDGWPLMHLAARFDRLEVVKVLLAQGASADERHPLQRRAPMNHAQSAPMVELLLGHGADINAQDHNGFTRLHGAAVMGDAEMVRFLLERGADPVVKTKGGQTPWALAVRYHHHEAAEAVFQAPKK